MEIVNRSYVNRTITVEIRKEIRVNSTYNMYCPPGLSYLPTALVQVIDIVDPDRMEDYKELYEEHMLRVARDLKTKVSSVEPDYKNCTWVVLLGKISHTWLSYPSLYIILYKTLLGLPLGGSLMESLILQNIIGGVI